jgi:putative membrane protein
MSIHPLKKEHEMNTQFITGLASLAGGFLLLVGNTSAFADEAKNDPMAQSFLKEAAQGGMMEVTLGQMAAEKAQNEAVKNFGQRMVKDHGQANEELKDLAKSEGVPLPSDMGSEGKDLQQRLQRLSGAEFDQAYMQEMLKDHKKDIEVFNQQAQNGKDPEVKNWATKTLPTLREHYQLGQTAAEKIGIKTSAVDSSTDRVSSSRDMEKISPPERMGTAQSSQK